MNAPREGVAPEVAPFPVLALEIREAASGGGEVWLDGSRVAEGLPVGDPGLYAAGVSAAAVRAGERPGGAVRVLALSAPDGSRHELIVDAAGSVWPVGEEGRARSWQGMGRRQRVGVIAAVTVAVLSVGGMVGWAWPDQAEAPRAATSSAPSAPRPPVPTATQLPVLGPSGQVVTARWASEPVLSTDAPVVVAAGRVVTVTKSGRLAAFDPRSSARVWSVSLGERGRQPRLVSTARAGVPVVVVATSSGVLVVEAGAGRVVTRRDLASGETAVATATGPVIAHRGGVTASVSDRGRWVTRVVPPGSVPVAVRAGALVTMNAAGQWWQVTSDRVPPPMQQLPSPEPGATAHGVVGASAAGLLFAWRSKDGQRQLVQLYSWTDFTRPARTVSAGEAAGGSARPDDARLSQDGSWFVLDRSLVDLATGSVRTLPDQWSTEVVLQDRAYASPRGSSARVVSRAGVAGPEAASVTGSSVQVGVPAAAVDGVGLVLADDGRGDVRMFGITLDPVPTPTSSGASAPSSTPSGTPSAASSTSATGGGSR